MTDEPPRGEWSRWMFAADLRSRFNLTSVNSNQTGRMIRNRWEVETKQCICSVVGEPIVDRHIYRYRDTLPDPETAAEFATQWRTDRGISRNKVSKLCGLSSATIKNIENPHKPTRLTTWSKWCAGMGVPLSTILEYLVQEHST